MPERQHPLTLGTRAARWGAVAVAVGLAIMAVPVVQGYREGPGAPVEASSAWEVLRQMGREMAVRE
ncbi:hypothetical protein [Jannaschia rubra]|uniref:Uncharacterized protein n=1 Tax=Jannaschia rubra TaxID=282197 RepID=A0A0M6XMW6_9RHOB|nr:hypothetical protein [Jannaschia rubra]CTQ32012.1 hypothetical protein JAN5088_00771 [Jannaschia rubra]SFG39880.1 hypothetical protein SAMN04488517_104223 [Jannaschia rubra]